VLGDVETATSSSSETRSPIVALMARNVMLDRMKTTANVRPTAAACVPSWPSPPP
jgi:hypothetical protein